MASLCSVDAEASIVLLIRSGKPFTSQRLPSPRMFEELYWTRAHAQSNQNHYCVVPVFDVTENARAVGRDDMSKAVHGLSEGVHW